MDKDENGWAAHAGTCQLEALGDRGRHELRPQLPVCQMRLSLPSTSREPDIVHQQVHAMLMPSGMVPVPPSNRLGVVWIFQFRVRDGRCFRLVPVEPDCRRAADHGYCPASRFSGVPHPPSSEPRGP